VVERVLEQHSKNGSCLEYYLSEADSNITMLVVQRIEEKMIYRMY
jgi:hypothetical protein